MKTLTVSLRQKGKKYEAAEMVCAFQFVASRRFRCLVDDWRAFGGGFEPWQCWREVQRDRHLALRQQSDRKRYWGHAHRDLQLRDHHYGHYEPCKQRYRAVGNHDYRQLHA